MAVAALGWGAGTGANLEGAEWVGVEDAAKAAEVGEEVGAVKGAVTVGWVVGVGVEGTRWGSHGAK